jgi:acyl carrier protein
MKLEMADLFGVNRDYEQAYKNAPWYDILGLGDLAWGNVGYAAWQKLYGDALGSTPSSLLPVDMAWHEHVKRLFDVKNAVRITKSGKGYRVFLPVYHGPMNPLGFFQGANPWYAQDGIEIARRLEAAIPNITDPMQSIDQRLNLSLGSLGLTYLDFGFTEEDEDALDKLAGLRTKKDLGGDELDAIEIVMDLEEEFDVEIDDGWLGSKGDDPTMGELAELVVALRK